MSKKSRYPAIPRGKGREEALTELAEILVGARGDGMDRALTVRDLLDKGIRIGGIGGGGGQVIPWPGGGGGGEFVVDASTKPVGVEATGAFSMIFLTWGPPLYHGHAYAEIWRSAIDDFATAARVGTQASNLFADNVGMGAAFYYWIRFVNMNGQVGPIHDTAGAFAETAPSITAIMDELSDQINETQLAQSLSERIDLIDKPATGLVDRLTQEITDRAAAVAAEAAARAQDFEDEAAARTVALQQEAAARAQALLDEATTRGQALLDEAAARDAAIAQEATVRQSEDESIAQQIGTLSGNLDTEIGTLTAALEGEQTARADAVAAEATARQTLAAQLRGTYTGTDIAAVTTGLLHSERTARVDADGALSQQVDALGASVATELGSLTAALEEEATARASGDSAEAAQRTTLAAQLRGNYAGNNLDGVTTGLLYQERIARSMQDAALAQQLSLLSAGVGGSFDPYRTWYFEADTDGWSAINATASWGQGEVTLTATDAGPALQRGGLTLHGAGYSVIKARVRRLGGSGWSGTAYYATDGHGYGAQRKTIADPGVSEWVVLEWDMAQLTSGGTDWQDSQITGIRLQLGAGAGDNFLIDWIAVGRSAPGASAASVVDEAAARAQADAAEAMAREALSSKLIGTPDPDDVDNLAQVTSGLLADERNARSTADASEVSARQLLSSKVLGTANPNSVNTIGQLSAGLLFQERQARTTADTALTQSLSQLSATVGDNTAAITDEATTRASADTALANSITALSATFSSDLDDAIEGAITTSLNSATALVSSESTARANADTALGRRVDGVIATADANTAAITAEATARANQYQSLTQQISAQGSSFNDAIDAAISSEATTRANADTALANRTSSLESKVNHSTTGVAASAAAINTLRGTVTQQGNTLTAHTQQFNQIQAIVGSNYSALQTMYNVTVGPGGLSAQYMLKTDVNGYVAGYGLYNSGTQATFVFRADRFAIGSPGAANRYPFIYDGGVLYLDTVMVKNGSIQSAQIGSLAADKITAGTVSATLWLNAANIYGGSLNINNRFVVASNGQVIIRSATSGARMEMQSHFIKSFDASGVKRVQLGDLTA